MTGKKIGVMNATMIIGMLSNIFLMILGSFPIVGSSFTGTLLISTVDYDPDPTIQFPIPADLPPVAPRRDVTGPNAQ